ncbi:MAG: hypothetical protein GY788_15055 [bacterium]|nr:hypothetical protein [bacterium]
MSLWRPAGMLIAYSMGRPEMARLITSCEDLLGAFEDVVGLSETYPLVAAGAVFVV